MKAKNDSGLTLLEILIGITISAVIFVMLLSALRLGQRSQEKGEERQEVSQRMRVLGDRLGWLLRGAYPYVVKTPDETKLYFSGSGESVGFVTTSVDTYSEGPEDLAGLKWVSIAVGEEGLMVGESVFFLEEVLEGTTSTEYTLEPSVKKIRFEYLGSDEEGEDTWQDEWETEDERLPSAVRFTLVLEHGEGELEMPPVVAVIRAGKVLGAKKEETEELE